MLDIDEMHCCYQSSVISVQIACAELCQNPSDWSPWRSVLSEEQTPQVIVFSRKLEEKGERLDRAFVRRGRCVNTPLNAMFEHTKRIDWERRGEQLLCKFGR